MRLTINKLFGDPSITGAVINRVMQTKLDTIYWKEWGSFLETRNRVFKTYLGTITGVTAGSIISKNDNKPIRERRDLGSGVTEIAYLGDRYQMDIDRLSDLQDLVNKFNSAGSADQTAILNTIVDFITDDYRQVLLAPHKRMDLVVGEMLMTGKASVQLADNKENISVLDIELPFNFVKPQASEKDTFISYLQKKTNELKPTLGTYSKMVMNRETFAKHIAGCKEFGEYFKMIMGDKEVYASAGLIGSELASRVFQSLGLPSIEVKDDYVQTQDGKNTAVYSSDRITFLTNDDVMRMRCHTPYIMTDPVPNRTYTQAEGLMSICSYRDEEGRYLEYTAEWIPEFVNPNRIVNFDLSKLK